MKPYYDAVIITPLSEEFEGVLRHFKFEEDLSTDSLVRFRISVDRPDLRILLIKQEKMGRMAAQNALLSTLVECDVGLAVCVGIAGALSGDLNIGDVCYSKQIVDVLDNAKISEKDGKAEISFSPHWYETPVELITIINRNKFNPSLKPLFEQWQENTFEEGKKLIPGQFTGKNSREESIEKPDIDDGIICCGDVCASEKYRDKVRGIDRKVLAIETESGGLFGAAKLKSVSALTIRGISDYADGDKNRFEQETGGKARAVAINSAASFLRYQLNSDLMAGWFSRCRQHYESNGRQLSLLAVVPSDPLGDLIRKQNERFEVKLRELAPTYSLQAKGYHLPIPRIRLRDDKSGVAENVWGDPIEIREAMQKSRIVILSVPKDYPDLSLSWLIGQDVLTATINKKQSLPFVIEGRAIRRPNHGIKEHLDEVLNGGEPLEEVQSVFVIDDFSFDSKTRTDFLLQQLKEYPEANFVILTKNSTNVVTESTFAGSASATIASLDQVSFFEIAHFLQKNFELTAPASEVVATRLQDTFSKFDLSAHPSYFSGIPRDVLAALLEANRRGELIQLAVAGYLSFVVASDSSAISLSRTTRERFLTDLAAALHVEKRTLSEKELEAYVTDLATKYDYGVSPKEFVRAFVDKGILHFEDGNVCFTLPFMEAYLLAKRLHGDENATLKYFELTDDEFDMPTFALYAELGAHASFIAAVEKNVEDRIAELQQQTNEESILLGDKIHPAMFNRPERLEGIQKRVRRAVVDVRSNKDQSQEKQGLLDAANRMREKASERSEAVQNETKNSESTKAELLGGAVRVWAIGVNMLGSGAERIEAQTKRKFIAQIVELTCLIIDFWTRIHSEVDFKAMREEAKVDQELIGLLAKSDSDQDIAEAKRLADGLLDLFEFMFLAEPFRRVIDTLCEEARDKVLAASFVDEVKGEPLTVVQSIWLADIDAKRGREGLLRSIRALPNAQFLRVAIATHLMTRVTWNHWKKADRLILLDAANELLKPFGKSYNYDEIRRLIEADDD